MEIKSKYLTLNKYSLNHIIKLTYSYTIKYSINTANIIFLHYACTAYTLLYCTNSTTKTLILLTTSRQDKLELIQQKYIKLLKKYPKLFTNDSHLELICHSKTYLIKNFSSPNSKALGS